MVFPRLRHNLEAFPADVSGRSMICFRDPLGFNSGMVFVPVELLEIIRMLDGEHSIEDIQLALMRSYGELVYKEIIQKIVDEMDEHLLLDSDRFNQVRDQIEGGFRNSPVRRSAHAGRSYWSDPEMLRRQLDGFFSPPEGSGPPSENSSSGKTVKGIISPHIDLRVGGSCYSWAYKELVESSDADLFIIFGTAHAQCNSLLTPTRKDFETPLGLMRTDKDFVDELERRYCNGAPIDDIGHRIEHSIEFQVIFLQHLLGGKRDIEIVPILCSSFHEFVRTNTQPDSAPVVKDFIRALNETIKSSGKKVCFIVGGDLAHVGLKFGDPFPAQAVLRRVGEEDLQMLRYVERIDAAGFFNFIQREGDQRKICGFPPTYMLLKTIEASEGKLLKYDQWSEEPTRSAVTYASMAFY